mmetsp:Transcript_71885/g.160961  ORF Transcript_71885/g.160961 Transcript_71885/m.160961 type:complete len:221 (+) Transcript_71885:113-775(+)
MPRFPLYKCFGFQSGIQRSPSPFLPNFSILRIFRLLLFSTAWAVSSLGKPFILLWLRARAAEAARSTEPSSPPAVASRFRLPSKDCGLFLDADLPRTLVPSKPLSFSSFSTSSARFLALRMVGWWFTFLFSLLSNRFWRILLCISSNKSSVFRYSFRTPSSLRTVASRMSNASSRSSSSSRLSISGSTKSAMFLPSMISGMTSYFHELSSRMVFLQTSTE